MLRFPVGCADLLVEPLEVVSNPSPFADAVSFRTLTDG
jgi:hypothetical protein